MKVRIAISDFGHTVDFLIYSGPWNPEHGDVMKTARPIELEFVKLEKQMRVEPTFRIDGGHEFLQSLRDQLDELGVPSNRHAKVEGLLEAQKSHLEDMRSLVFKKKS